MNIQSFTVSNCIFCELNATYDELPICDCCLRRLQKAFEQKCKICGNTNDKCNCNRKSPDKIRSLFFFDCPTSRILIYRMKSCFEQRQMDFFAELLLQKCDIEPHHFDAVTFVPRRKRNIRLYGYDQAEELAKSISKVFKIPFVCALKRVGKGDQKLLSFEKRKEQARKKFGLCYIPEQKLKRVLLVDDIITTGATIDVCAEKLRKDFAEQVFPMVLAKTNREK